MVEAVRASGLHRMVGEALAPWRKPLAVHDPAKVLIDLAVHRGGVRLGQASSAR